MSKNLAPSTTRKTAIGATWMVAWRMVTRVLGLGSTLVLARILVPADFGLVAMANTAAIAIDALSELGLQEALVRRPNDDRSLFDAAFTLQLGRAVVTALLIALGAPAASWWFGEPRLTAMLLVLAALAAISGLENVGVVEFRRELRYDRQFVLLAVPRLAQVVATVTAALLLRSYWALLIGIGVNRLVRVFATYAAHPYRPALGLSGWRDLASFSFWTWVSSLTRIVWERCDPVLLGPILGPARLGVYLLAAEVATLPITELISPATDVLYASFAAVYKRGEDVMQAASMVAVTLVMGVTPLVIALSAASGDFVAALLGQRWAAAQPLIAILAWLCLFSPFSFVCSSVLVARGLVRLNFVGNLAAAAIKLAALVVTIMLTDRLMVIASVTILVIAAEAAGFLAIVVRAGGVAPRTVLPGLARIALAGAVAASLLAASRLGWQPPSASGIVALLHAALVAGVALASFAGGLAVLWRVAGRPIGPERMFGDAIGSVVDVGAMRRRLRLT